VVAAADVDRPLFTYFKQLFAQVSNPPIDYIREELVTSLETRIGNQRNLLDETPEHAEQIVSDTPVLTDAETAAAAARTPLARANASRPTERATSRTRRRSPR